MFLQILAQLKSEEILQELVKASVRILHERGKSDAYFKTTYKEVSNFHVEVSVEICIIRNDK